jgi:hypothetical protein
MADEEPWSIFSRGVGGALLRKSTHLLTAVFFYIPVVGRFGLLAVIGHLFG